MLPKPTFLQKMIIFPALFLLSGLMLPFLSIAQAPIPCPPNIDFEFGNFTNWSVFAGTATVQGGVNVLNLGSSAPIAGRHTIINATSGNATDQYGLFPVRCPNGSGNSIRLGNSGTGAQAERIRYSINVPANATEYSLRYYYAVVFQDPGHGVEQQPRFTVKVFDPVVNEYVPCANFDYIATSNLPGFQKSNIALNVWYKDWTPVSLNLTGYAGRQLVLEFSTADCTIGGHFGYAYVDVDNNCSNFVVDGRRYCPGQTSLNMAGPPGYQGYNWFDNNFNPLGSGINISLTPPPPVNSIIALEVIPYPGFGCVDTFYTRLEVAPIPSVQIAPAGPTTFCEGSSVVINSTTDPANTFVWYKDGVQISGVNTGSFTAVSSGQYHCMVTNPNGCEKVSDSVKVIVHSRPTVAINNTGNLGFCIGGQVTLKTTVTAGSGSITGYQWFRNGNPLPGADKDSLVVNTTGTYNLKVFNSNGCEAISGSEQVVVFPRPTGTVSSVDTVICEGIPVQLTATGAAVYEWYRNGQLINGATGSQYSTGLPGTYTVNLISADGCRNQATGSVNLGLIRKPQARFRFSGGCSGLPVSFTNLSDITGSRQVDYRWDFGNGGNSTDANPVYSYPKGGVFNVQLTVTPRLCPQNKSTVTIPITIEDPRPGITYYPVNALSGKNAFLQARSFGAAYRWQPADFLSNPFTGAPVFKGNAERLYFVTITSPAGCVTVDTQLVRIFDKGADILVPKAFTPNNDGQNDRLFPFLVGIRELRYFRIVNRWGNIVYNAARDLPGWDGTINGKPQPSETYGWEAMGIDFEGNVVRRNGNFTLIR